MKRKPFDPTFNTPADKLCKEELNKIAAGSIAGNVKQDFADPSRDDIPWESEALAKSHGIYLEFNRAKESTEAKEWIYMMRISIPGGGPLTREQYNVVHDLATKYCKDPDGIPSVRLTNRQNIQFHWIRKQHALTVIKTLAESGLNTLNGCGDNTRNVMACPVSRFSTVLNANELAQKAGTYFQLPIEPFISVWEIDPTKIRKPGESFNYGAKLLNRKFKIGFAAVIEDASGKLVVDNCAEVLTDDMGIIPIINNGKVNKFQIYIGGGQGERNGKPSLACLGKPLCQVDEKNLLKVMDAVVKVHQQWGDRENRIYARIKFVVKKLGIDWYRDQVEQLIGFKLEQPIANLDIGSRHMHHGWIKQPSNGLWTYGAFIENGRLIDNSPNGKLMEMVHFIMNKYDVEFIITPNQDALFCNLKENQKQEFENDLKSFGYGKRNGKEYSNLRLRSGACVGRDTCRLTYTDSEKFEPFLIDELEALGWGDLTESIGITGCERQCFRPATKTIGLVGSGFNRYQMKLMGTEDGKNQGLPLLSEDGDSIYLKSIPRERVAQVIDVLIKFWQANKKPNEELGYFNRRVGQAAIIAHFKENSVTADLMTKTLVADCVIEG